MAEGQEVERKMARAGDGATAKGLAHEEADLPPSALSTPELVRQLLKEMGQLVKTQVQLAAAEVRSDLRTEVRAVKTLAVAALAALCTLNLLLVTGVLALARVLPGWAAGLIVAGAVGVVAAVAGLLGWRRRVRAPLLEKTRQGLEEDTRWAKRRTV